MKKIAVVYWSGTGNTEAMANAVAEGARAAGAEVELSAVSAFSRELMSGFDAVALGCPAMGDEILDEDEMEPFVASLTAADVQGKKLALFGSYDWGDGEWMRAWSKRMRDLGASLVSDGLIVQLAPGNEELKECRALGNTLALDKAIA
jgi:flavodoxin I